MRIAVDARELSGSPTGVGRYLTEILTAWKSLPEAASHEVVLLRPDAGTGGTRWEQVTLPRLLWQQGADVLFAPAYTGPVLCPVPMVLTIHDVSFAAHPEWFSAQEGMRRRQFTRLAAHRAARILTVSEFSKSEIVAHLQVPWARVEVIYSGLHPLQSVHSDPHAIREPESVLFVGSLFNRRHVPELVAGFSGLAQRHAGARLDIVGENRTMPRIDVDALVRDAGAADRIRVHSYVSDETLGGLYARAGAFAFLSDYEGFGFTPLEALAAGVPIVVLDTAVAREIYSDAAIYVARPDPVLIERALEEALFDPQARARVLQAAGAVLARYSWTECARRTLRALVTV